MTMRHAACCRRRSRCGGWRCGRGACWGWPRLWCYSWSLSFLTSLTALSWMGSRAKHITGGAGCLGVAGVAALQHVLKMFLPWKTQYQYHEPMLGHAAAGFNPLFQCVYYSTINFVLIKLLVTHYLHLEHLTDETNTVICLARLVLLGQTFSKCKIFVHVS